MAASIPPSKPHGVPVPGNLSLAGSRPAASLEPPPWQSALVYGLGVSGVAASRLLLRRGVRVFAVDDSESLELPADLEENSGFLLLAGSECTGNQAPMVEPQDVDVIVVSPGVSKDRTLVRRAIAQQRPIVGEVEIAFQLLLEENRAAAQRIVGITGSNGKSTTTEMVAALLAPHGIACGNIGVPFADCVWDLETSVVEPSGAQASNVETPNAEARNEVFAQTLVVELSSFQLDDIDQFRAPAAALLNVSPDHQDRHGTVARYVEAKRRIFSKQVPGDIAVLNHDDEVASATPLNPGVRRRTFSLKRVVEDGCYLAEDTVFLVEPNNDPVEIFKVCDMGVIGEHNLANAMAAVLLAIPFGLDIDAVPAILGRFSGLPHRTQLVTSFRGVRWYDDSKGTNVGATEKSLVGFPDGSVHLIAGGLAKGGGFSMLREVVAAKVAGLYLIGEAAEEIARDLGDLVPVRQSGSMERAVRSALESAKPGQVVLLSPACASFDQYESFSQRGLAYQEQVHLQTRLQATQVGRAEQSDGMGDGMGDGRAEAGDGDGDGEGENG